MVPGVITKAKPACGRAQKSPAGKARLFSFFYSKFIISGWGSKSANVVGVRWRVSACKSEIITLVKRSGA
jgi:hypothetical protein